MSSVAIIEPQIDTDESRLASAWVSYQMADTDRKAAIAERLTRGMEFGKECYEMREKYEKKGFRGAIVTPVTNGEPHSFEQLCDKLSIVRMTAYRWITKYEKAEGLQRKALLEQPQIESDDFEFRHCSMAELLTSLGDVDAIITDPPYPQEYLPLYPELAKLAAQCLKPDGILAVMSGHSYLPQILHEMSQFMEYRWMMAYMMPTGGVSAWDRKVNTFWKPILLFGGKPDWIGDVVKSDAGDKRFHEWGQSESGARELIEKLSKPGQLVCDPFMGGGTNAVACAQLGRRFVGCDVDEECVRIAKARVSSVLSECLTKS